jgi:hypothetical protein
MKSIETTNVYLGEIINSAFDFSEDIKELDTITSVTARAVKSNDGTDVTADIFPDAAVITDKTVEIKTYTNTLLIAIETTYICNITAISNNGYEIIKRFILDVII